MARSCASKTISRGSSIALLLAAIPVTEAADVAAPINAEEIDALAVPTESTSISGEPDVVSDTNESQIEDGGIDSDGNRLRVIASNISMIPFLAKLSDSQTEANASMHFQDSLREAAQKEDLTGEEKQKLTDKLDDLAYEVFSKALPTKPYETMDDAVGMVRRQMQDVIGSNTAKALSDRISATIEILTAMENTPVRDAAAKVVASLHEKLDFLTPEWLDARREKLERARMGNQNALLAMLKQLQAKQEQAKQVKADEEAKRLDSDESAEGEGEAVVSEHGSASETQPEVATTEQIAVEN